jgi:hypothetical protein
MSKNDDFDKFLKDIFQKDNRLIKDEGFTEKVISNLPARRSISLKRNGILFIVSILSVSIFFISTGYNTLFNSIFEILNNISYLIKPSLISVIIICVFISVQFCIAKIEYDKDAI